MMMVWFVQDCGVFEVQLTARGYYFSMIQSLKVGELLKASLGCTGR
jgi:hypothetical protein